MPNAEIWLSLLVLFVLFVILVLFAMLYQNAPETFQANLHDSSIRRTIVYTETPRTDIVKRADDMNEQLDLLCLRRPTIKLSTVAPANKTAVVIYYSDVLRVWMMRDRPIVITTLKSPRQLFFFQKKNGLFDKVTELPPIVRIGYVYLEEKVLAQRVLEACNVDMTRWVWNKEADYKTLFASLDTYDTSVVLLNKESPSWEPLLNVGYRWLTYETIDMSRLQASVPFAYRIMRELSMSLRNPKVPLPPKTVAGNVVCIDTCLVYTTYPQLEPEAISKLHQDLLYTANQPTRNNEYSRYFKMIDDTISDMKEYNKDIMETFANNTSSTRKNHTTFSGAIGIHSYERRVLAKPDMFIYTTPRILPQWGVRMQVGDRVLDTDTNTYLYVIMVDENIAQLSQAMAWPKLAAFKTAYSDDIYYDEWEHRIGRKTSDGITWNKVSNSWDNTEDDPRFRCVDEPTNMNRFICPNNSWDRPCEVDEECPFYTPGVHKSGGCKSGYCEMPNGVKRVGYRKYKSIEMAECKDCPSYMKSKNCCSSNPDKSYAFPSDHRKDVVYEDGQSTASIKLIPSFMDINIRDGVMNAGRYVLEKTQNVLKKAYSDPAVSATLSPYIKYLYM